MITTGQFEQFELFIFDIDGTLAETRSGETFRDGADDWQWKDGRLEVLRDMWQSGKKLALASNQGGVAFGYFTEPAILAEGVQMISDITGLVGLDKFYLGMCFSHPTATIAEYKKQDIHRKPGGAMMIEAAQFYGILPFRCLVIGDRPEDKKAAAAAHMAYIDAEDFFIHYNLEVPGCSWTGCTQTADMLCQTCRRWLCGPHYEKLHLPAPGQSIEDFFTSF